MSGAFRSKSDPAVDEALTKTISFSFQYSEKSGAGRKYLYAHFHTSVSLHVPGKVWAEMNWGTLQGWERLSFKEQGNGLSMLTLIF